MENISLLPSPQSHSEILAEIQTIADTYGESFDQWRIPLAVARRTQAILLRHKIDPRSFNPSVLASLLDGFARSNDLAESEMFATLVCDVWPSVHVPEGYKPTQYAFALARIDTRIPLISCDFLNDATLGFARLIVLAVEHLTHIAASMKKEPFLSTRAISDELGFSFKSAAVILRKLILAGDLIQVSAPTRQKAGVYRRFTQGSQD